MRNGDDLNSNDVKDIKDEVGEDKRVRRWEEIKKIGHGTEDEI